MAPTTLRQYPSGEEHCKAAVHCRPFLLFLESMLRRTTTGPLKTVVFVDDVAFIHDSANSTSTTPQALDIMSKCTGLRINLSQTTTMTLQRYRRPSITPDEPNQDNWERHCPICGRGFRNKRAFTDTKDFLPRLPFLRHVKAA